MRCTCFESAPDKVIELSFDQVMALMLAIQGLSCMSSALANSDSKVNEAMTKNWILSFVSGVVMTTGVGGYIGVAPREEIIKNIMSEMDTLQIKLVSVFRELGEYSVMNISDREYCEHCKSNNPKLTKRSTVSSDCIGHSCVNSIEEMKALLKAEEDERNAE